MKSTGFWGAMTNIEWTDETWNPITGCIPISQGCKNCWSKALHDMRHKAHLSGKKMPPQYATPFEIVNVHPDRLEIPLRWKAPRLIFSPSGADPFHEDVPLDFLYELYAVFYNAHWHTFQMLTKRADRMVEFYKSFCRMRLARVIHAQNARRKPEFADLVTVEEIAADIQWPLLNLWPGVSVENRDALWRLDRLRQIPAACRMVSFEPLLEDLGEIDLTGIGWGIVGGESNKPAKKARQFNPLWACGILRQFRRAGEPFFMKQFGSNCYWRDPEAPHDPTKYSLETELLRTRAAVALGAELEHWRQMKFKDPHGGDPEEWPEVIRVREFPKPYPGHTVIRLKRKSREEVAVA